MKFYPSPLTLIIIALPILIGCRGNQEKVAEEEEEILLTEQEVNTICNNDLSRAHRAAEKLVEESVGLKSAYGEEFAWLTEPKVTSLGNCTYDVRSQLESQDPQGREISMKYHVVLQYQGEGKWKALTMEKGAVEAAKD